MDELTWVNLDDNNFSGCMPDYLDDLHFRGWQQPWFLMPVCDDPIHPEDAEVLAIFYAAVNYYAPEWRFSESDISIDENGRVVRLILTDEPMGVVAAGNIRPVKLAARDTSGGRIPPELGNLASLRVLKIENRDLTGEIPPELGNLVNLRYLHLNGNRLTGRIPSQLSNLANLLELNLNVNDLRGEIPPAVS